MLAQGVFEVLRLHLQNFGPSGSALREGTTIHFSPSRHAPTPPVALNTTMEYRTLRYRTFGGTLHRVHAVLSRELIWSVEPPPLRQASTSRGHPALAFVA